MNEVTKEKTMTTKEIAEALGVSVQAIIDRAKQIGKIIVRGKPTFFTKAEATAILELMKMNPSHNLGVSKSKENNLQAQLVGSELNNSKVENFQVELGSSNDNNSEKTILSTTTELTPVTQAYSALKQFGAALNGFDHKQLRDATALVQMMYQQVVDALNKHNEELEHQLEYDKVIGWYRWKDVKKELGIPTRTSFTKICEEYGFCEGVDYERKCMGLDKFPTILLAPSTVDALKDSDDN